MQELKKAIYLYALPRMFISFIVVFLFVFLLGVHYNPFFAIAIIAAIASVSFTMLALYEKHVIEEYTSGTPFYARLKLPDGDIGELQNSIESVEEFEVRDLERVIEITETMKPPETKEDKEEDKKGKKEQKGKKKKDLRDKLQISKELFEKIKGESIKAYLLRFKDPVEIKDYVVQEAIVYSDNLNADLAPYSDIEFAVRGCFITLSAAVMTWQVIGIMPLGEGKKGEKLGRILAIVIDSKAKDKIPQKEIDKAAISCLLANAVEIKTRLEEEKKVLEKKQKATKKALDAAMAKLLETEGERTDMADLDVIIKASKPVKKYIVWALAFIAAAIVGIVIGTLFGHIFVGLMRR